MAPIRVRFSPDSSQEQDFSESTLLQRGFKTPEELQRFSEAAIAWFSFPLERLKICEKNALREILLQRVSAKVK
jgi:hypothetical protein